MKNLTIRVSDELHAEIAEAAKRVELSINSLTCIALKRLLKELRDVKEEDGVIFLGRREKMKTLYMEDENANCNGGSYPIFILMEKDKFLGWGHRCACFNGCSNTVSRGELIEKYGEWDEEIFIPKEEVDQVINSHIEALVAASMLYNKYHS